MTDLNKEVITVLGRFFYRDYMYLVGGGSILVTLSFVFNLPIPSEISSAIWILVVGVAYGIGFVVQETLSLTPLITTAPVVRPGGHVKTLY